MSEDSSSSAPKRQKTQTECNRCNRIECCKMKEHWEKDFDNTRDFVCCQCYSADGTSTPLKNLCKFCAVLPVICADCGIGECSNCQTNSLYVELRGMCCCSCFCDGMNRTVDVDDYCTSCRHRHLEYSLQSDDVVEIPIPIKMPGTPPLTKVECGEILWIVNRCEKTEFQIGVYLRNAFEQLKSSFTNIHVELLEEKLTPEKREAIHHRMSILYKFASLSPSDYEESTLKLFEVVLGENVYSKIKNGFIDLTRNLLPCVNLAGAVIMVQLK